jgi:aspartyl-tRNA(Asn)/glutamyl-tRNA(Gln) amidotransferase subunit C
MKLSRDEVLHIAQLARLGLTEDELDKFQGQLYNILENFEVYSK